MRHLGLRCRRRKAGGLLPTERANRQPKMLAPRAAMSPHGFSHRSVINCISGEVSSFEMHINCKLVQFTAPQGLAL